MLIRRSICSLVLLLAGCGDDAPPATAGGASCATAADCPGATCSLGLCADTGSSSATVSLLFRPRESQGAVVEQVVRDIPVTLGSPLPPFVLADAIPVHGRVVFASGTGPATAATSQVVIRPRAGIAGASRPLTLDTVGDRGSFDVLLAPGDYDITVSPRALEAAAVVLSGIEASNEKSEWTLPVPDPAVLTTVRGVVIRMDPLLGELPVGGVQVAGASEDGRVLLEDTVTDATGSFAVRIPPGPGRYRFHVRPGPGSVSVSADLSARTFSDATLTSGLRLEVGQWSAPRRVVWDVRGADGQPLPSTTVLVAGSLPRGAGAQDGDRVSVLLRAATDPETGAPPSAQLPPGVYQTFVLGRGLSDGAARIDEIVVPVDSGEGPFTVQVALSAAAQAGITLRDVAGAGVADLDFRLLPTRILGVDLSASGIPPWSLAIDASTDSSGVAWVAIPPGSYSVEFDDPAGLPGLRGSRPLERGTGPGPDVVLVPARGVIASEVLDSTGAPVGELDVLAFEDGSRGPVLIGVATTDMSGRFRMLVAPTAGNLSQRTPVGSQ
jgi:hypothetical protein